jgi:hypothetical protein
VKARAGSYIDRNRITVGAYLDDWLEAHAMQVKPKTLQDYRHLINRHTACSLSTTSLLIPVRGAASCSTCGGSTSI